MRNATAWIVVGITPSNYPKSPEKTLKKRKTHLLFGHLIFWAVLPQAKLHILGDSASFRLGPHR